MRIQLIMLLWIALATLVGPTPTWAQDRELSAAQLERLLKRFPEADANGDGQLSLTEAQQYRQSMKRGGGTGKRSGKGGSLQFDSGWDEAEFPEKAVSRKSAQEIKEIYANLIRPNEPAVVSFERPTDGSLRLIGTGHSFMAPAYRTLPIITKAAGFKQPMYTHTGGGMTGSARYKWEQENGIFDFDGRPTPKLLASIANARWDVMTWGPYYQDRPEFYTCWIDFCLKHNQEMKFYLSDAWPQLAQIDPRPQDESVFTDALLAQLGQQRRQEYSGLIKKIRQASTDQVFVLPTSDAMVLAARRQRKGQLPGIDGIHKLVGGNSKSIWRDQIGHLGPGLEWLEGYVFYATLYGRSPESLKLDIRAHAKNGFPSVELDREFRRIAWEAVVNHPLSGVQDQDGDGVAD